MRLKYWIPALFFTLTAFAAGSARAAVWETARNWDADWEARYQAWIQANWDENFFNRPGVFQGMVLDCADAVYGARLVFASENGLPFAVRDNTGGDKHITNAMTRWDRLPPDQRKRKFAEYIFDVMSTTSLAYDTYPVAVTRDAIGPGTVLRTDDNSHHSWTVKFIAETGVPYLIYSTRPARTTLLRRFQFPTKEFIFTGMLREERNSGFRAWRWPEYLDLPAWQVPGYSHEQYEIPLASWTATVQKRLQLRNETPSEKISRLLNNACRNARERAPIVSQGEALLRTLGGGCMNAQQYDDFSTPSRDSRMQADFKELATTYRAFQKAGTPIDATIDSRARSVLSGDASVNEGIKAYCLVEVSPGTNVTLGTIYQRSVTDKMSNNPHDGWMARWGFDVFPGAKAAACPTY